MLCCLFNFEIILDLVKINSNNSINRNNSNGSSHSLNESSINLY